MYKFLKTAFFSFLCLFIVSSNVSSQNLKVSLAQMPVYAESTEKGVLVDMAKLISKELGKELELQVVPFIRSLDNAINGTVNFHAPLILNPNIDEKTLKYKHSTETIFHVNFVLYTTKDSKLTKDNLEGKNLETDAAHVQYFPFKVNPSTNLEGSLQKLNAGRIDGFIFADNASDPIIEKLGLTNIRRQLYYRFDVKIILPKNSAGEATDKELSKAIAALRKSGEWDKVMSVLDQPYKD